MSAETCVDSGNLVNERAIDGGHFLDSSFQPIETIRHVGPKLPDLPFDRADLPFDRVKALAYLGEHDSEPVAQRIRLAHGQQDTQRSEKVIGISAGH